MSKSHDENDDLFAYRAKWVFPVGQAPIENGIVVCRGDVIQSVSSLSPSATQDHSCSTVFDLGDQAIVPPLLNTRLKTVKTLPSQRASLNRLPQASLRLERLRLRPGACPLMNLS